MWLSAFVAALQMAAALPPPPPNLRDLKTDELKLLFKSVSAANSALPHAGPEVFRAGGRYEAQVRGAVLHGRFWVADNELCITTEADPAPVCRRFAIDEHRGIYLTAYRHGEQSSPVEVSVQYYLNTIVEEK